MGPGRWLRETLFYLPILYLAISKCHYTEEIQFSWRDDSFLYKASLGSGRYAGMTNSKCNALWYLSSTRSYWLVIDFCNPHYILPLRVILTVYLQHPFQKELVIIDKDDQQILPVPGSIKTSCPSLLCTDLSLNWHSWFVFKCGKSQFMQRPELLWF